MSSQGMDGLNIIRVNFGLNRQTVWSCPPTITN